MEMWMWIIAGSMAVAGFFWGFVYGRSGDAETTAAKEKAHDLETEVNKLKTDMADYRNEVTQHFRTTADLVHQMTASYKAVYEHLAGGSQKLCAGEVMLEMEESPRLTSGSAGASAASTAGTTSEHTAQA